MKNNDHIGDHTKAAQQAVTEGEFKGVPLKNNKKLQRVNRLQFLSSITDNLKQRCFTTQSSNVKSTSFIDKNNRDLYTQLLTDMDILNPDSWPSDLNILYGRDSVLRLIERFRLDNKQQILSGFQDYLENGGKKYPAQLNPLVDCITSLPCSSSECERGFSSMNTILTETRNRITSMHLSSLMFIKLNGPPIHKWNALPYVKSWLREHHAATTTKGKHVTQREDCSTDKDELWALF